MICIYHRIDADGVSSAALINMYAERIGKEITNIGYHYGDVLDVSKFTNETVVLVDVALPAKDMQSLYDNNYLVWIDHHKTAIDEASKWKYNNCEGLRCTGFAACELTYRYLLNIGFKAGIDYTLLNYIGLYDCFAGMNCENTKEDVFSFTLGLRSLDILNIEDMSNFLRKKTGYTADVCISRGKIVNSYIISEYRNLLNNAVVYGYKDIVKDKVYKCLYIKGDRVNLYNYFNETVINADIVICENITGAGGLSLYSNKVDVSEIALQHGGGGHKGASGIPNKTAGIFIRHFLLDWEPNTDGITNVEFEL